MPSRRLLLTLAGACGILVPAILAAGGAAARPGGVWLGRPAPASWRPSLAGAAALALARGAGTPGGAARACSCRSYWSSPACRSPGFARCPGRPCSRWRWPGSRWSSPRAGRAAAPPGLPPARVRRCSWSPRPRPRPGRTAGRRAALPDGRGEPPPRRRRVARARLRRGPLRGVPRRAARAALPRAGPRRRDLLAPRGGPVAADPARVGLRRLRRASPSSWRSSPRSSRGRCAQWVEGLTGRDGLAEAAGWLFALVAAARSLRRARVHRGARRSRAVVRPAPRARRGARPAARSPSGSPRPRCRGSTCATRRSPSWWSPTRSGGTAGRAWRPRSSRPLVASASASLAYHHALYGFYDPRPRLRPPAGDGAVDGARGPAGALPRPGVRPSRLRAGPRARSPRPRRCSGARPPAGAARPWPRCVVVLASSWPMWRGGFNPPGRFLVPIVAGARGGGRARVGTARAHRRRGAARRLDAVDGHRRRARPAARPPRPRRDGASLPAALWRPRVDGPAAGRSCSSDPDRRRAGGRMGRGPARRRAVAHARGRRRCRVAVACAGPRRGGPGGRGALSRAAPTIATPCGSSAARRSRSPAGERRRPAAGEWSVDGLGWGPLYEPHRHPAGAEVGRRLLRSAPAATGSSSMPTTSRERPVCRARGVGGRAAGAPWRAVARREGRAGWDADFELRPGARAWACGCAGEAPCCPEGLSLAVQPTGPGPV